MGGTEGGCPGHQKMTGAQGTGRDPVGAEAGEAGEAGGGGSQGPGGHPVHWGDVKLPQNSSEPRNGPEAGAGRPGRRGREGSGGQVMSAAMETHQGSGGFKQEADLGPESPSKPTFRWWGKDMKMIKPSSSRN